MKKCTEIGKPLVSILLAVYKPNEKWLIEQLISLNKQSYSNLELIVYDDCPEFPTNKELFEKYITNFKYDIIIGKENKGSNYAFEELTKVSHGEYLAYCDQDDIWEINKIEKLIDIINEEKSILVYSDMIPIDKNGNKIGNTLIDIKPRVVYRYGNNLLTNIFFKNFISGCSMLISRDIAYKALPFSKVTIHDQWLALIASAYGKISFVNEPLVKYRIHDNNQTKSLNGVFSKEDYYKIRVDILEERLYELNRCISNLNTEDIKRICTDRKYKRLLGIINFRKINRKEAYFEVFIKYIPNWLFKIVIERLK